jgi:hypothetical protein
MDADYSNNTDRFHEVDYYEVQDFYIYLLLKRMPMYFMVNSVCPSLILNLFTLIAFALPPGKIFKDCLILNLKKKN